MHPKASLSPGNSLRLVFSLAGGLLLLRARVGDDKMKIIIPMRGLIYQPVGGVGRTVKEGDEASGGWLRVCGVGDSLERDGVWWWWW